MPDLNMQPAESRKDQGFRALCFCLWGGWAGESRDEGVSPVLQVHWTLPTASVRHGPDLWADDGSATSGSSWHSLAPCPSPTSASHSASKISRGSSWKPAYLVWAQKAQFQHDPWIHRYVHKYKQVPHPRMCVPNTNRDLLWPLPTQALSPRRSSSLPRTATRSGLRL